MKIALALERFDPERGGLEHWTWQFAERLVVLGHDVHVVACEFAAQKLSESVHYHTVPQCRWPLQRAEAFERLLRSLNFDIIHDMGVGWYGDIMHPHGGSSRACHEHKLLRIPRWRQIRLWRERRYREHAEVERRQHAQQGAIIVAVSRMVEGHFRSLHKVPPERLRIITNGVDTDYFSPAVCASLRAPQRQELGCASRHTLFLLVAHNLRLKNADSTIRALAELLREGHEASLAIVGGKKPEPFIRLAKKLGICDRVIFISATPDVRPFYAAADVYLHPTWYDPCSLVALEALACGLPVITTRFNGVSELIKEGHEGHILDDPASVSALTSTMRGLLDPARRVAMGESARRMALLHTFSQQTESFLGLYREVIARRTTATPRFPA